MAFVGIDVSKDYLDVCERPSGEASRVKNTDEEIGALVARLVALAPTLVVVEVDGQAREDRQARRSSARALRRGCATGASGARR